MYVYFRLVWSCPIKYGMIIETVMKHQRPRVMGVGECYRCPEESADLSRRRLIVIMSFNQ